MSRDQVDVAKRVVDAYNRRDVDGLFAELATPDFVWYPALVRALMGAATADAWASSGSTSTPAKTGSNSKPPLRSFAISAIACLCWAWSRDAASGAPVDQPFAGIFDFRGDRICRYRVYFDHAEGLRA